MGGKEYEILAPEWSRKTPIHGEGKILSETNSSKKKGQKEHRPPKRLKKKNVPEF